MGILDIFRRKKDYTLTDVSLKAIFQSLNITDGKFVGAARNSMDTWGLYFGKAKFRMYEQRGNEFNEVFNHNGLLLFKRPNPYHHWFYYAYNIPTHWGLFGVAYFRALRNPMGKIVGYQMLYPPLVSRKSINNEYLSYYEYNDGTNTLKIEPKDMIELPYPNPNGDGSYSPILEGVLEEQVIAKYILAYTKKFYEEGGFLGLTFSTTANLSKQDFTKLRDALEERYGKQKNAFKVTLTDNGLVPIKSAYSMKDADVTQLRKDLDRAIYNAFKVGDILVGSAEAANRSNAEAVIYQFTSGVVDPLLSYMDSILTRHIQNEYGDKYTIEHDSLAPKDQEASLKYYESGLKNGWLTIDEVREMERYNKFNFGISNVSTINVGGALIRVDTESQIAKEPNNKTFQTKKLVTDGFATLEVENKTKLRKYFDLQRRRVLDAVKVNFNIEQAFDLASEKDFMYQVLEMQIFRSMEQGAIRMFSSYGLDRTINFVNAQDELNKIFGAIALSNETLKNAFMKASNMTELVDIMNRMYPETIETAGLVMTNASWNYGTLLALKSMGIKSKTWQSIIDEKTRRPEGSHTEDHVTIHNTTIGIDEYFVLPARNGKTDFMLYPSDPSGSPENIINCRCKLSGGENESL